ncbi:hypothetical protein [Leisingera sp. JC11]|uniref:hypothetical protein n=1 Tax=Leisingera sp. JC11 TaxID=3042469 RepID=UPI003453DAF8
MDMIFPNGRVVSIAAIKFTPGQELSMVVPNSDIQREIYAPEKRKTTQKVSSQSNYTRMTNRRRRAVQ